MGKVEATCRLADTFYSPITRGSSKSLHPQRPVSCDIGHPARGHVRAELARRFSISLPNRLPATPQNFPHIALYDISLDDMTSYAL